MRLSLAYFLEQYFILYGHQVGSDYPGRARECSADSWLALTAGQRKECCFQACTPREMSGERAHRLMLHSYSGQGVEPLETNTGSDSASYVRSVSTSFS